MKERMASPRRTLLQRGLMLAGGALGLSALRPAESRAEAAPAARTLVLHGRRRPVTRLGLGPAQGSAQSAAWGELLDAPGGKPTGEFHSYRLGADGPFGPGTGPAGLELQVLRLADGLLFGIVAGGAALEKAHAIVGGTGRFAGACGSYLEREVFSGPAGRGAVEFVVSLTA